MELSTGVNMRAKLSIAPKSTANHSALDKYFFLLLLPSGAWYGCWQLVRMDFAHTLPRWLPEPGEASGHWHCPEATPSGAFGVFGVHSARFFQAYPEWAWFRGLCRSVLLKAALGQAAVSKHWDGVAQGRAHSSHSPGKEPNFHTFSCKGLA